jgi:hypothetical protein
MVHVHMHHLSAPTTVWCLSHHGASKDSPYRAERTAGILMGLGSFRNSELFKQVTVQWFLWDNAKDLLD